MKVVLFIIIIIFLITVVISYVSKKKYEKSNYKSESGTKYDELSEDKGKYGEYLTFNKLEKIDGKHRILANVYVPTANGKTTEIDVIYIHETGIYVIESKNFSGWIYGNENHKTWTQVLKNGRKEKFYNPIWQNNSHIKNLLRVLEVDEKHVRSLVVFSERCTLKDVTVTSKNVQVVKRENLINTIKKLISESKVEFEEGQIIEMYYKLKAYSNVSEEVKETHINNINIKKNGHSTQNVNKNKQYYDIKEPILSVNEGEKSIEDIEEAVIDNSKISDATDNLLTKALKDYRTERSKFYKIPPYNIFTNKELVDIVSYKPNSIEELREIKGFGEKKCLTYGDDILKIINNNIDKK